MPIPTQLSRFLNLFHLTGHEPTGRNEGYIWRHDKDGSYLLHPPQEFKLATLAIRSLPRGTRLEPLDIGQKVRDVWTGIPRTTEIDTALDIEGLEEAEGSLIIARFFAGNFMYGASYLYSIVKYGRRDRDFTELDRLVERVENYFGVTLQQFQAFFTDSNLPETARLSVRELINYKVT